MNLKEIFNSSFEFQETTTQKRKEKEISFTTTVQNPLKATQVTGPKHYPSLKSFTDTSQTE